MRIAIDTLFEHPEHPSSAINYLVDAVRFLPNARPDHEFVVFVSPRNRYHFEDLVQPNVYLLNCLISNESVPLRIVAQQTILPRRLRHHRVDVLFSPGNVCPLFGNFCRVLKINTLHHYHTPELIGEMRSFYRKVAFSLSAHKADHIVANTETTRREIIELIGVPPEKVSVVLEASFDTCRPVPRRQAESVCRRYGLKPDYVLFVSALYPYKNIETLMHAYSRLGIEGRATSDLVILGRDTDSQLPKLQALAGRLGIKENTRFLGFIEKEEMPYFYSAARVFVFPSLVETFGKPLIEAMQCGVPVVASNSSVIPEVVGDAGLLVNPLDSAEMSTAIARVASDETLRQQLISRGVVRGKQFCWENTAKQTLRVLEQTHLEWLARANGTAV